MGGLEFCSDAPVPREHSGGIEAATHGRPSDQDASRSSLPRNHSTSLVEGHLYDFGFHTRVRKLVVGKRMMEAPSLYELFQLKPARYLNQRSEREFRMYAPFVLPMKVGIAYFHNLLAKRAL